MYISKRYKLNDIDRPHIPIALLKENFEILIIDDKNPPTASTLRNLGFRIREFRDIESIDQVEKYPIVACDIEGIGSRFTRSSQVGGYKVLKEIRKNYPDKYLIQYSTKSPDMDSSLTQADSVFPKDTSIELWQDHLEKALQELGNPKTRWIRLRNNLSAKGLDGYEIFKIEQAYIKSIKYKNTNSLESEGEKSTFTPEIKELIRNFAITTAQTLLTSYLQ